MSNTFDKLVAKLDALSHFCPTNIVFKVTSSLIVEEALPLHLRCHNCKFCLEVKKNPEKRAKCIDNDLIEIPAKLKPNMEYLVTQCHANVKEVVLPLTSNNTIIGAVLCGPFRSEDELDNPLANEHFQKLPVLTNEMPKYLHEIIVPLLQQLAQNAYASYVNSIKNSVNDVRILKALDYINANYKEKITIASVSHICALSQSRFTHLFTEQCKISFSDYLQNIRIIEAKKFLAGSNYSIAEIALICGFATQSHFSQIFKKLCAITPQNYRQITQKTFTA